MIDSHGLMKVSDLNAIANLSTTLHDEGENYRDVALMLDGFCLVMYKMIHTSYYLDYLFISDNRFVDYSWMRVKEDKSIPHKMYSCSGIFCMTCRRYSAVLSDTGIGDFACQAAGCGSMGDFCGFYKSDVSELLTKADAMKLYPRWRWRQ